MTERKVYLCDHKNNTECPKTSCMFNPAAYPRACYKTYDERFAQRNEDGKPIIVEVIKADPEYAGL